MNLTIDRFAIGAGRTFVVAEIGNNHNGSLERALHMIDVATDCGADCAKFQMRDLDEVYRQRTLRNEGNDLGTEYVLDLLRRFELSLDAHKQLAAHCAKRGILYLCTPWDSRSVDVLSDLGVPAYKVASADLSNLPLLDRLCATGKPPLSSRHGRRPRGIAGKVYSSWTFHLLTRREPHLHELQRGRFRHSR